jgi:hypothetical protein
MTNMPIESRFPHARRGLTSALLMLLAPGTGAVVQAQFWYRDPFAPTNTKTSMSDAIEFSVEP